MHNNRHNIRLLHAHNYMAGIKRTAADNWFSLYIRKRDNWTCQRCGKKFPEYIEGGDNRALAGLDCCHFYGRGTKMTRFEPDNVVSMCYGCHTYMDAHPLEFWQMMVDRIGEERLDEIEVLSKQTFRNFKKEQNAISKKFRELFRNAQKEND